VVFIYLILVLRLAHNKRVNSQLNINTPIG
jgi:hypothetical protein